MAPRLIAADGPRQRLGDFDFAGAVLGTGGMLLLIYTLVKAPSVGWGSARTVAGLGLVAALLAVFALNERRQRAPLFPFSILRYKGLAAANLTQMIAIAGFFSVFFLLTLYMQNVLGYSQIQAGLAYLPTTIGVGVAAGICSQLVPRVGTRAIIVAGSLLASGAVLYLASIPVDGSYAGDLLPGLVAMALGLGAVFVGVTTAANAGVPVERAGLAAALINTSQQLGSALGVAIFTAIAASRTQDLLARGSSQPQALTSGFELALTICAAFLLAAAIVALRATDTRGEPLADEQPERGVAPVAAPDPAEP